ncbi:MAG: thiol:disulfide interchange protein DsbA/DsbL [Pseudoxanthomonas sp.]|nr:thiol:disulfide interchange protein DsbA/DsbL [Pseudoxanthomonas sp.]MBP8742100.1 thiol:disulfide interchange protein DsbA/DsbL [Pseudoxanthomonas sp.]MBP8908876.1 thiol:disulfide interchange protein DsbA/DsbL [Pseudoxanthomonas sp.]MBP9536472.1 thiol:disulfide interchange protein DsbA/DsbL [Pseudoxanthomonas sp.]MBP9644454.1 thiol:disulfide interchange protein DsbA/DsbL [Pseudoxanthomonas sp.]
MKPFVSALLLLALAWLPGAALAQSTPQAGRDYVEIPGGQAWAARPGRIEVAELFGYTCPHCAHFEPLLAQWKQRQGKDVDLALVPAVYGGAWDVWARAFFAASDLGLLPRSHEAVFAAIHRDGRLPRNPSAQELGTFFSSYGVDGDRFRAAMADPKVDARMDRAREFAIASGAEGTPTLVVNGRYRVTAASLEDALRITDWLVARERGRAGGGAKAAP